MGNKILFYIDAKLGRKWMKFIPVYGSGEELEREKQIIHAFKDAVDEEFKEGYIDKDCVFYFNTNASEALQFIWKHLENWMYTMDYTSYKRVLDKIKAAKEKTNLDCNKQNTPLNNEITE